ncbi:hypothetical protein [Silvimonas sp.]|jgi:hypothetical protein|uniref:hypothetical protein n=1 Tax=Silvimonas sp. TaxID=2650811 RepID=UPI00283B64C9|nr:hypothetical protein [Silvimonas sp.]MDR3428096.1 hypothetical protein [Silvimonas sp.]
MSDTVDFSAVNRAALANFSAIVTRWLPGGRFAGHEYSARNPKRNDRNEGSFMINTRTGAWSDFATGDKGGDPVSLAAYLFGMNQPDAARKMAVMLGLEAGK